MLLLFQTKKIFPKKQTQKDTLVTLMIMHSFVYAKKKNKSKLLKLLKDISKHFKFITVESKDRIYAFE